MLAYAEARCDATRRLELRHMALPVAKAEGMDVESLIERNGRGGCGVHSAAQEDHRFGSGHRANLVRLFEKMLERSRKIRKSELVTHLFEPGRQDPGAGEQRALAHVAEDESERRTGNDQWRRSPQGAGEAAGELRIPDGMRGGDVYRTRQVTISQDVVDDLHGLIEANPTHPLSAWPDSASKPSSERRQHFLERSTLTAQHHAKPRVHHADPGVPSLLCRSLPPETDRHQEIPSRIPDGTSFREFLVAAISVYPDGRGRHHDLWPGLQPGNRSTEQLCAKHSAVVDSPSCSRGPAGGDILSGQIDDRVDPGQRRKIEARSHGIPEDLVLPGRPADQPGDPVSLGLEMFDEGSADQATGAAHQQVTWHHLDSCSKA